jgi:hypothetical protein
MRDCRRSRRRLLIDTRGASGIRRDHFAALNRPENSHISMERKRR